MTEVYWIEEKKFTKLFGRLKEIGLHCSYPNKEELLKLLADIGVKVMRKSKKKDVNYDN